MSKRSSWSRRTKVVRILCVAVSLSILAVTICTIAVNFDVSLVIYHHDYHTPILCADSAFHCNNVQLRSKENDIQVAMAISNEHVPATHGQNSSTSRISPNHAHTASTVKQVSGGSHGYVIVGTFEEQLCSAIFDLYQITNIANKWNMTFVEPSIQGSQFNFQAVPPTSPASLHRLKYRDVFDLEATNRLFGSCLKTKHNVITPLERFLEQAYKIEYLVVIYFEQFRFSQRICEKKYNPEILHMKKEFSTKLKAWSLSRANGNRVSQADFTETPHSIVCIDIRNGTNFRYLLDMDKNIKLITRSHSNILVLIPKWRGVRTTPHKFFYYDPYYEQPPCGTMHTLPHSRRVQSAAEKYQNFLQIEHPFLGVHIRLERLIRRDRERFRYMANCLREFFTVLQTLVTSHNLTRHRSTRVVAFTDYSSFGSSTCSSISCKKVAKSLELDEKLNELGVVLANFRPDMFNEPAVSGYVAIVELEMLSRADYLIAVGHGSYHTRLFNRFYVNQQFDWKTKTDKIESGDGERLFTVCPYV